MASAFGAPPDIDFGPSKRSKMKKWRTPGRTSPTDREREMLAEWVGVAYSTLFKLNSNDARDLYQKSFNVAESMLREFRARYGVTGAEAEVEAIRDPDDITLKAAIGMLHPDKTLTIYDSDCMGVIRHDSGVVEWGFDSLPELIAILKGGKSGQA